MKDQLDQAIDTITARMTHVEKDHGLAGRIVLALPQRPTLLGSLLGSWTLRFAALALVAGASMIVLRTFDDRSTKVLRTENAASVAPPSIVEPLPNARRTPVEPPLIVRRTNVERPLNDRGTESDHEFGLPALDAVASLEDEALTVAPLEIADLPLTSDFPRD